MMRKRTTMTTTRTSTTMTTPKNNGHPCFFSLIPALRVFVRSAIERYIIANNTNTTVLKFFGTLQFLMGI